MNIQNGIFRDTAAVTAHYRTQDLLTQAEREQILLDARPPRHAMMTGIGQLLVRLGQRLQGLAQQPTYTEETI